jgi:protease I
MEDKLILIVIGEKDFNSEQFGTIKEACESEAIDIKIANLYGASSESVSGEIVEADLSIIQAEPDDYDAIILIGGAGAEDYYCDDTTLEMLRDANKLGVVIAALSNASITLANAGILKNIRANTNEISKPILSSKGAIISDTDPESDHGIITSNGAKMQDFIKEIFNKMKANE